jgi:hypothetical protein
MLRVIGELADGWVCPNGKRSSTGLRAKPGARRLYNVLGAIDGTGDQGLFGTSEH